MVSLRYREESSRDGGLQVWEDPIPGAEYTIGIDCAGGGAAGDFATAVAIENGSCDIAAIYRKRMDAGPWGEKCVLLGEKFNGALLAFETAPSAFGLAAARVAAVEIGYANVYRSQRITTSVSESSANLGWHTDTASKAALIERVKRACRGPAQTGETHRQPCDELRIELAQRQWIGEKEKDSADKFKFGGKGHDDLVIGWGIALCVRDLTWVRPAAYVTKAPSAFKERFWDWRKEKMAAWNTEPQKRERVYAGI